MPLKNKSCKIQNKMLFSWQADKNIDEFQVSVYGAFASLFPHRRTRSRDRGVIVTYPCQRDGPEGYDWEAGTLAQAQAEALQANKSTMAHTHTHSYTQIKAQMKILLKSLLLRQEFLKDAAACDKRFKLKPKYLEQAFTTQTNCS